MCGAFAQQMQVRYWAVGSEGRACVEHVLNYSLSQKKLGPGEIRTYVTIPIPSRCHLALPMSYHCATTLFYIKEGDFAPIYTKQLMKIKLKLKKQNRKGKTKIKVCERERRGVRGLLLRGLSCLPRRPPPGLLRHSPPRLLRHPPPRLLRHPPPAAGSFYAARRRVLLHRPPPGPSTPPAGSSSPTFGFD